MKTNNKKEEFSSSKAFKQLVKDMAGTGIQVFNALDAEAFPVVNGGKRIGERSRSFSEWSAEKEGVAPLTSASLTLTVETIIRMASYMHMKPVTCALLVIIISRQLGEFHAVLLGDVRRFLAAEMVDIYPLRKEMEWLESQGYIKYVCSMRNEGYKCLDYIVSAVLNNNTFEKPQPMVFDRYKFCETVDKYVERGTRESSSTWQILEKMKSLEAKYQNLKMVKIITSSIEKDIDRLMFYELCDICVSGDRDKVTLDQIVYEIISDGSQRYKYVNSFLEGGNQLLVEGLAELKPSSMTNDTQVVLSERGMEVLFEDDIRAAKKRKGGVSDIIRPEDIGDVRLFFEGESDTTISELKNALDEKNFKRLQSRLAERNLPKGVAAVFYGAPGTGKTELARQIARETGRAIMQVDISRTKSCWVGESEKLVKGIFSEYRNLCSDEKLKPILLFNEADAILTSRIDPSSSNNSSVVQMMNAMQNIILEEMERLDGILIATTNLHTTLDAAFERRFLYKIKFGKPDKTARKNIWMSKMPSLTEDEAMTLSSRHELSGGEIDNVVRKTMIDEVLSGEKSGFDKIESYCRGERFSKERGVKIGF